MTRKAFQFKQFKVFHDQATMKVGTDAVLLGAWSNINNVNNILDIGTGSGIIALMLAQRSDALIDAIEIDESSARQAIDNFSLSPWKERMRVLQTSFLKYSTTCTKKYDLFVSNPPYFHNSLKSQESNRNLARHNDELPFEDLVSGIAGLLNESGKACIILPVNESNTLKETALKHGLYCNFQTEVVSKAGHRPNRLLMEFSKQKRETIISSICIMNADLNYTEDFKSLTKDFYLDF
ncbi:MAG: methyltransferase [Bacteroidetes bacterium]|nr:methyltransferase [Bacteroidota bacterium]